MCFSTVSERLLLLLFGFDLASMLSFGCYKLEVALQFVVAVNMSLIHAPTGI